jgi:acyl carrier protein
VTVLGVPGAVAAMPPRRGIHCGTGETHMETDEKKIQQKVVDIVVEQLDVSADQVKMETRFVDDLGADSLDQAELVMEFEDEFGLDIPENEESIRTVGDAVKYIVEQLKSKES